MLLQVLPFKEQKHLYHLDNFMQAKALFVNTILITLFSSASLLAVDPGVGDTTQTEAPQNWHHMDQSSQNFQGISLNKAYQDVLKGKKSKR